jgi:hypothetical protein
MVTNWKFSPITCVFAILGLNDLWTLPNLNTIYFLSHTHLFSYALSSMLHSFGASRVVYYNYHQQVQMYLSFWNDNWPIIRHCLWPLQFKPLAVFLRAYASLLKISQGFAIVLSGYEPWILFWEPSQHSVTDKR